MRINCSPPPSILDAITDIVDGQITSNDWDCDIKSILAYLINMRTESALQNGAPPEPGFEFAVRRQMSLAQLIANDLVRLSPLHPFLERAESIVVLEAFSQNPNAQIFPQVKTSSGQHLVIVFHTPIIWYLNSFFQKFHILAADDSHADCLEIHKPAMEADIYDDLHILLAVFDDMEILFNQKFITRPTTPPFLGQPYDLCEQVIGARQFVVSHEIGHFVIHLTGDDEGIEIFRGNLQRSMAGALTDRQMEAWAVEIWCDEFALRTLNQCYLRMPDGQNRQDFIGNSLRGILLFLFMLHIMEVSLGLHEQRFLGYPPASVRYGLVCKMMQQLSLFEDSFTQTGIRLFHRRLSSTRKVLAGLTASVKYGSLNLALAVHATDFSRTLSQRLFTHVALDTQGLARSPWEKDIFND